MNEQEKKRIADAFIATEAAAHFLERAAKLLAEFGENVPEINPKAIETFAEQLKSIGFSTGFLQSFLRISFLKQIVKKTTTECDQKDNCSEYRETKKAPCHSNFADCIHHKFLTKKQETSQ